MCNRCTSVNIILQHRPDSVKGESATCQRQATMLCPPERCNCQQGSGDHRGYPVCCELRKSTAGGRFPSRAGAAYGTGAEGYCFMRGGDRTFRADRILEWAVDEPGWPTREALPASAVAAAVSATPPFAPKHATSARGAGSGAVTRVPRKDRHLERHTRCGLRVGRCGPRRLDW